MYKLLFVFVIFTPVIGCYNLPQIDASVFPQKDTSFECNCTYDMEPFYNLDTLLSGGYHLKYYNTYNVMDSGCYQIVDLMNGPKKVKSINSMDYRFNHVRLGWKELDARDKFVFVIGVLGMPNFLLIIEKKTGKNLLTGFFHHRLGEVILYSTFEDESGVQKLRILDMTNETDIEIKDFQDYKCQWDEEYFGDCVQLDSISNSFIWLSMEETKELVVKKFKR